jgi:hypothetical protein
MREPERKRIAGWVTEVLAAPEDAAVQARVHGQVKELGAHFPAPADAC